MEELSEASGQRRDDLFEILHFTTLDLQLEASLLSFFGWLGRVDTYWQQVRPTLERGPWLIVAAAIKPKSKSGVGIQRFQALLHCWPHDGDSAIMSHVFVASHHLADLGLMAAVYKGALESLMARRMVNIHYLVRQRANLIRRILLDTGFAVVNTISGPSGDHFEAFEAPIDRVLTELGLDTTPMEKLLDPAFGASPDFDRLAYFQSILQLGGLNQPADIGGTLKQMGGLHTEAEPGEPSGPDSGRIVEAEPGEPGGEPK